MTTTLKKWPVMLTWLFCLPFLSSAQNKSDTRPVTSAYILTGATLIAAPGSIQQNITILIEDGMIRTVGSRVPVPSYARVIECDSMYVYSGFIEGLAHTGIPARDKDNNKDRPRVDNPGTPPNDLAGIQPDRGIREVFKNGDRSIDAQRKLGFTVSHVVPRGNMLPGMGSVVLLNDGNVDALILKEDISMYAQFRGAQRMYPTTVIGVIAKWRDLYRHAKYKKQHQETFEHSSGGIERPQYDRATEAMFAVIDGLPVFFNAANSNQIHQAYHLQEDLGFNLVLAETKQGYRLTDKIKATDRTVLISLDLPEDKSKKSKSKKDDEEKDDEGKEKEVTAAEMEKSKLEERRQETLTDYYSQAATLEDAGIPIAFSLINTKAKDVHANLRKMIEHGLSEEAALAALTTIPAQLLGIDSYTGTVEPGKMANLVVSIKPYFDEHAQVRYVFVEGVLHEYELKKEKGKKKSTDGEQDPTDAPVNIEGTWSFEVEIPGDPRTGIITITGEPGDYNGEIQDDDDDEVQDLNDIVLEGATLSFTMEMDGGGNSMTLEFELEFNGDTYEGDVSVGEIGTFPIAGEKIPD